MTPEKLKKIRERFAAIQSGDCDGSGIQGAMASFAESTLPELLDYVAELERRNEHLAYWNNELERNVEGLRAYIDRPLDNLLYEEIPERELELRFSQLREFTKKLIAENKALPK